MFFPPQVIIRPANCGEDEGEMAVIGWGDVLETYDTSTLQEVNGGTPLR